MRKRGRSLSFDRPRALNSLEDELARLQSSATSMADALPVINEPIIYRILENRDFVSPWMSVDRTTRGIIETSRMKALAARRQVISDTLKCCVVSEHIPNSENVEELYDFSHDLDSRSIGIISKKNAPLGTNSVRTRREIGAVDTPTYHGIDVSLGSYLDAFSAEDLFTQLPVNEEGSSDTSNVSAITKTIPWFTYFTEIVQLRNVATMSVLFKTIQAGFSRIKDLYTRISKKASALYNSRWNQVVADRLDILNRNFPKGVLGYRALTSPEDPRHVKALIMKQAGQQIFGGMSRMNRLTEAEAREMEKETGSDLNTSKHAFVPDMKRVWSALPRVHFTNTNGLVESMCAAEHESVDDMAPWNLGEVRVFLERLAMHGKNFKRIASNLSEKTEKDCVEFYYRFKVHLNMKQIVSAGNQNRAERNSQGNSTSAAANYRTLVDQAIEELERFLKTTSSPSHLCGRNMLETWNIFKRSETADARNGIEKVYGRDADPESPRRERRNAMIDVLVSVISRGYSVPPQLTLLVESASSMATTPVVVAVPPTVPVRRVSLSVVQTAVTLFQINAGQDTRLLQPHNTI